MRGGVGSVAMEGEGTTRKVTAAQVLSLFVLLILSLTGFMLLPSWGPLEAYRAPLEGRELYLQQVLLLHALLGLVAVVPILLYIWRHMRLKRELSEGSHRYRMSVRIGYLLFVLTGLAIVSGVFLTFKGAFPAAVQLHRWGGIIFFTVLLFHVIFLKGTSEG